MITAPALKPTVFPIAGPGLAPDKSVAPFTILLLLALIPAASGSERGTLIPGLKLSDIISIVLAALILMIWLGRWRILDGLGRTVLIYAIAAATLTMINFSERTDLPIADLWKEAFSVAQYLLLFGIAYAVGQHSRSILDWLKPSLIIASLMSLIALAQMVDLPGVRATLAWYTGNTEIVVPFEWKVYRGTALFPSWHALGMYLCIHVVLAVALYTRGNVDKRHRRLLFLSVVTCSLGILTTSTATPILVAAASIIGFALTGRRVGIVIALIVAGVFAISLTPLGAALADRLNRQFGEGRSGILPQSFEYRLDIWARDFIPIINENLVTGYGPMGPMDANLFAYTESMYILLLLTGGGILLVTFMVFMVGAFVRMTTIGKTSNVLEVRAAAQALRFLLVALLLGMIIHPYFNDAGSAPMMLATLGVISGVAYRHERVAW